MTHLTDSTSRIQERSYSIILETFERRLRLGELRVGDKLPSERALAEKHGISRPSVREALRILNALGLIRSSSGSGPKSGAIVISEPSDTLSWALRMHIATRNLPVKDVVSTRLLLEGPAARAAANAPASPERDLALENAREHLREMDLPQVSNEFPFLRYPLSLRTFKAGRKHCARYRDRFTAHGDYQLRAGGGAAAARLGFRQADASRPAPGHLRGDLHP